MIEEFGKNDQEDRLAPKRGAQPRGRTCRPARLNAMPTAWRVIPYWVAICCRVLPATYSRYAVATQAVIRGAEGAGSCCSTTHPLLLGGRSEDVGAEVMAGHPERSLNEQRELGRDRTPARNPLADELRGSANGLRQSGLATGVVYCFLDWGRVHVARVALLFRRRNSIATSFFRRALVALLYG